MKNNFYITTPIYYPNAKPHIGTLYSTVIADTFARFYKLLGKNVCFLTGLDQHGQKVAEAAHHAGMHCQEFVDSITKLYKKIFKQWHIEYDIFMETTSSYHTKAVQEWIKSLQKAGYIYKGSYQGWYSISQENFLTEKDIEIVNENGIPLCPISQKEAVWISQDAYYFKLSLFSDKLLTFFKEHPQFIVPAERTEEIISFIKQGLKDLCISRLKKDLSWGIPFPDDNEHVIYVWADALNNYLTGVGYLQTDRKTLFENFWPCDLHVMAKDIIRFHTVYWLSFLMAANIPLPKRELVHGWLLFDNQKMSKSLGNIVDPEMILNDFHPDVIRYYFSTLSIKDDANFSIKELEQKYTSDLCDNISNLLQRTNALCIKHAFTMLHFQKENYYNQLEKDVIEMTIETQNSIIINLKNYQLQKINTLIIQYSSAINTYFHAKKPWTIIDKKELEKIFALIYYSLYNISVWLSPIMPTKMLELQTLLGTDCCLTKITFESLQNHNQYIFSIKKISNYLFEKKKLTKNENIYKNKLAISSINSTSTQKEETITLEEFTKNKILVGQIIAVEDIPKSNKLYYLSVDFGSIYGISKIASGIKNFFTPQEILHKKTLFCYNLAPRSLCGVISEGMILMTQNTQKIPQLVTIAEDVALGTQLG